MDKDTTLRNVNTKHLIQVTLLSRSRLPNRGVVCTPGQRTYIQPTGQTRRRGESLATVENIDLDTGSTSNSSHPILGTGNVTQYLLRYMDTPDVSRMCTSSVCNSSLIFCGTTQFFFEKERKTCLPGFKHKRDPGCLIHRPRLEWTGNRPLEFGYNENLKIDL